MSANRFKIWIESQVNLANSSEDDEHILIFTHGSVTKFLIAELFDLPRNRANKDIVIENTSITQFCYCDNILQSKVLIRNYVPASIKEATTNTLKKRKIKESSSLLNEHQLIPAEITPTLSL